MRSPLKDDKYSQLQIMPPSPATGQAQLFVFRISIILIQNKKKIPITFYVTQLRSNIEQDIFHSKSRYTVVKSEADLKSRGGTQAGENEGADVHAVLGNASEAAEHTQHERPLPLAARVVDHLNLPEQLVWLRDARAYYPTTSSGGEEAPDDASPEGAVGGPEFGGKAEEHGLGEEARLVRQDAEHRGDRRGNCERREELAEARTGGVEGLDARG